MEHFLMSYTYRPLNDLTKQSRLLVLKAACSTIEPIVVDILVEDLEDSTYVNYEALSYTWGASEDGSRDIRTVDSRVLRVRENLWWALYHLRHADRDRILWIDALCIDQENVGERNHQVRQMSKIYSQANGVLIWLGRDSKDSHLALDYLRHSPVHSELNELIISGFEPQSRSDYENYKNFRKKWWTGRHPLQAAISEEIVISFKNLCMRAYWRRLWIVQEILLAEHLTIHCGQSWASWTDFMACLEYIIIFPGQRWSEFSLTYRLHFRWGTRKNGIRLLLDLLSDFQDCECSDPRDMVYGLLGLADDCGEGDFVIDYSRPIVEVYRDLIRYHTNTISAKNMKSLKNQNDIMRFSIVIQKSLRLCPDTSYYPGFKESELLPSSENDNDFICGTGIFAGETTNILRSELEVLFSQYEITENDASKVVYIDSKISYAEPVPDQKKMRTSKILEPVSPTEKNQDTLSVTRGEPVILEVKGLPCYGNTATFLAIGPSQAQPGDQIVQFQDCDIAVVIRERQDSTYSIIGRVLVLNDSCSDIFWSGIEREPEYKFALPNHHLFQVMERLCSVYMDISTLQVLTR